MYINGQFIATVTQRDIIYASSTCSNHSNVCPPLIIIHKEVTSQSETAKSFASGNRQTKRKEKETYKSCHNKSRKAALSSPALILSGSASSNSTFATSNIFFARFLDISLSIEDPKHKDGSVYAKPLTAKVGFLEFLGWNTRTQRTRWPTRSGGSRRFVSRGCRSKISSTEYTRPSIS